MTTSVTVPLLGILACVGLTGGCRTSFTAVPAAPGGGALHVLLINGGGSPEGNFASHLEHLKRMLALLDGAGVPPERITVLSSDGADPAPDLAVRDADPPGLALLEGTAQGEGLRPPVALRNSVLPGVTPEPATRASVERYFARARTRMRPGDTLLLYVTDHGLDAPDPLDNRIVLWGGGGGLSVRQLRAQLERLPPGVRVVALMSQCYSGGFALLSERPSSCGYFASPADRPAYGCYPEAAGGERIGHSFEFMQALAAAGGRFADAHAAVLASDRTPDVPLRSSDVWLRALLDRAARAAGEDEERFIDGLLREAWRDRARFEPELRLLDRVAQGFGLPSPRSLAELERQGQRLPELLEALQSQGDDWRAALALAVAANLRRFESAQPRWASELRTPQRALTSELGQALVAFTDQDPPRRARIDTLSSKRAAAAEAAYRMEVRAAVLLRLRAQLVTLAGRVFLETRGRPEDRAAFAALRACEDFTLPVPRGKDVAAPASAPAPFPTMDDDLRVLREVTPGWMGIRYASIPPARRARLDVAAGAQVVVQVLPDSPAMAAGLQPGDIVLGPRGRPFTDEGEIKGWTMLLPAGQPQPLEILREARRLEVTLVPSERPLEPLPAAGPPKIGDTAPSLFGTPYRGAPPAALAARGSYLLFFWATWCAPCKEALPELLAYARDHQLPIVAITDESPAELDAFFARWRDPFPENVASDEERLGFYAYSVSGTPTFVLVGADRKIAGHAVGYRRDRGLVLPGGRGSEALP